MMEPRCQRLGASSRNNRASARDFMLVKQIAALLLRSAALQQPSGDQVGVLVEGCEE